MQVSSSPISPRRLMCSVSASLVCDASSCLQLSWPQPNANNALNTRVRTSKPLTQLPTPKSLPPSVPPPPPDGDPDSANAATRCNRDRDDLGHSPVPPSASVAVSDDDAPICTHENTVRNPLERLCIAGGGKLGRLQQPLGQQFYHGLDVYCRSSMLQKKKEGGPRHVEKALCTSSGTREKEGGS